MGPIRSQKRQSRLLAELVNLADYNKPPESKADSENFPRTSRRTRKTITCNDKHHVYAAAITKPRTKASAPKQRSHNKKLQAEVERLQSWYGWVSDEEDDSDTEDDRHPRSHTRHYPPKVSGTQNKPWTDLPGEVCNMIYEYATTNEEEKSINVVHYPGGVPRRSVRGIPSATNFSHSSWGFTQTCRQVRKEFMPWLLAKRRVRTPLATLDKYVKTFHHADQDGKYIGWIEAICCDALLAGRKQLDDINAFFFGSRLAQKEGMRLQASLNGGVARWVVRRPGVVDLQWRERKAQTFRRLTRVRGAPKGFVEESLD